MEDAATLSCLLETTALEKEGEKNYSMQVTEEIKQINVWQHVGLITEGPSITITNGPSPFFRRAASFQALAPPTWHKSCPEIYFSHQGNIT